MHNHDHDHTNTSTNTNTTTNTNNTTTNNKFDISIVIPSWNSINQLKQNLKYIKKSASRLNAEIIVVDDASTDGSADYIKQHHKDITLLINDRNEGFSYTVNRGVRLSHSDIVVLLNTDVRTHKDTFVNCLKAFKNRNDLFAVTFNSGEGWAGGNWSNGMFHHFPIKKPEHKEKNIEYSLWASGGQAGFSKSKWDELGGLDLVYKPFYWEDVDLGYRAWKRGWKIEWRKDITVVHDHKSSVIAANFTKKYINNIAQRNQFIFIWKNIHDKKLLIDHIKHIPLMMFRYPHTLFQALSKLPYIITKRYIEKTSSELTDREVLSIWSN